MSENKTTIKEIKKTVESWLESNRIKILNNNIDIEINRNEEDLYFWCYDNLVIDKDVESLDISTVGIKNE